MHAALDFVDERQWETNAMNLKLVDRFNDLLVYAFVTAGGSRFLLLHDQRNEENVRNFFHDVHELYLKILLNPFHSPRAPIVDETFDARVRGRAMPTPRAAVLIAEGEAALAQGDTQGAIDAFEAALAVDPGHTPIFLRLAEAARADSLQGKAIRYYREALTREPRNLAAIAGEGEALVEKGAVEMAKGSLAKLESLCGESCPETQTLSATIAAGPPARVQTAEALLPDAAVPQSN